MGTFLFLCVICIVIWICVKFSTLTKEANKEAALLREAEKRIKEGHKHISDDEFFERANYMSQLSEVKKQAEIVGDIATVKAVNEMRYQGKMPEKRDDGAYMSIYDNLRIFKIAGTNYRGDLSAYVGDFNGVLVPEPNNEYDSHAIMVKCEDGKHLGYIPEYHTNIVRWVVGAPQMIGDDKPTIFKPYRIKGRIELKTDENDGHNFYDGYVYVKKS